MCSKKLIEKGIEIPILFDTRYKEEKDAYKFGCQGTYQMGNKWMSCRMHNITIKTSVLSLLCLIEFKLFLLSRFALPFVKEVFTAVYKIN